MAAHPTPALQMVSIAWQIPKRLTQRAAAGLDSRMYEELKSRLARRQPDTVFNSVEAAIYTGRSARTLKRLLDAGLGPVPDKNPDITGKGATNQHLRYRKSVLDAWMIQGFTTAFSSRFSSFDALTEEQPWVFAEGRVFCHLLDFQDTDALVGLLGQEEVEFWRLDEVLLERWATPQLRALYQVAFSEVLEAVQADISSAVERGQIEGETGPALAQSARKPL